jgi:hypothetical protein
MAWRIHCDQRFLDSAAGSAARPEEGPERRGIRGLMGHVQHYDAWILGKKKNKLRLTASPANVNFHVGVVLSSDANEIQEVFFSQG